MKLTRPNVLLIARFETAYTREMVGGIMAYARQHTNWELTSRPAFDPADLARTPPAGLLVTGLEQRSERWARTSGTPLVVIGGAADSRTCSCVLVDNQAIGAMAVEHLAGLGLKHLGYVGHGPWPFVRARQEAFIAAARVRGYASIHQLIGSFEDRRSRSRFEADLAAMLRKLPRPCGLLAADDDLGVMVIKTCRHLGLRVPEDIAVLGIDDDQLACTLSEVPLSSVVQPLHALGYEAARLLHQHIEDPDKPTVQTLLPPLRVAARASSDLIALDDEDVVAALRLINYHMTEPINVDWIVRQLPVARRTLYRKFEAMVGRTILQQIHHVRFQKAKELLAESDLSLKVVARRSGFANARWLADSFRRDLKITPTRFRRQFRTES